MLAAEGFRRSRSWWWAVLLPLWILSLVYVWSSLDHGWIPQDEGTLAQPAARVALGELPHRDFDDVYTGGLDWLNAAAFRVFGTNLRSMRIVLFLVFAMWVPTLFWVATRFAPPLAAAPFVALGVTWSVPRHPQPMPSWYVLFLATFGTAALLKSLDEGRRRWIAVAGICCGLATLAKITGLHFAAAALLVLAWREPALTAGKIAPASNTSRLYPITLTALLASFVAVLVIQVWPVATRTGFVSQIEQFVLPGALVALLVTHRAWVGSRAPDGIRFRTLVRLVLPFLLGFVIPVAVFVAPYALAGAVGSLVEGVLILPQRRLVMKTAAIAPPPLWTIAFLVPVVAVSMLPAPRGRRWPKLLLVLSAIVLCAIAVWHSWHSYEPLWDIQLGLQHLLPLVAIVGAWRLRRPDSLGAPGAADRVMLVLTVTALLSLVQFPYTIPMYFFYFAPLLVISVLAVSSIKGSGLRESPGVVLVTCLMLAVMLLVSVLIGIRWPTTPLGRLGLERGGLKVVAADVEEYGRVVSLLRAHARGGYVWAGPDAPEIAFLTDLRNPTRTIFDFFDADFDGDPRARAERLFRELDDHGVTAVALNLRPSFSGMPSEQIVAGLRARYPTYVTVGRFAVGWKE